MIIKLVIENTKKLNLKYFSNLFLVKFLKINISDEKNIFKNLMANKIISLSQNIYKQNGLIISLAKKNPTFISINILVFQ